MELILNWSFFIGFIVGVGVVLLFTYLGKKLVEDTIDLDDRYNYPKK